MPPASTHTALGKDVCLQGGGVLHRCRANIDFTSVCALTLSGHLTLIVMFEQHTVSEDVLEFLPVVTHDEA
jgi:hypothetical protein